MPNIYPMDDMSSGSSKKNNQSEETKLVGIINANQVIESTVKRFITDEEKEKIYKSITEDTYDKDGDGYVDYALKSKTAINADIATNAINSQNAVHADSATISDTATNAINAENSENAIHSQTSDFSTHSETSTKADTADTAINSENATLANRSLISDSSNFATKSEVSESAESVEWSNILNKPEFFNPSIHTHSSEDIILEDNKNFVTTDQINIWNSKQDKIGYIPENISKKGIANGYAPLDTESKVPVENLPDVQWGNIKNIPNSSIDDIDNSVSMAHNHINFSILEAINLNNEQKPTLFNKEWPYAGDMKKSEYDQDNDGIIDTAKNAINVSWSGVSNKPTSSISDIDLAVMRSHSHMNLSSLNLLGVDGNGNPIWNNDKWPYDMKSSDFDKDNDGIVDKAKEALSIDYNNISNKPTSLVEDIDNSVSLSHNHSNKSIIDDIDYNYSNERMLFKGKEVAYISDSRSFIVEDSSKIETKQSVQIDIDGKLHLVNDTTFIDPFSYYGTNNKGLLGWHSVDDLITFIKPKLGNYLIYNNDDEIEFKGQDTAEYNKFYSLDENGNPGFYNISSSAILLHDDDNFISTKDLDDLHRVVEIIDGGIDPSGDTIINNYYYNITYDNRQTILSAMPNFFSLDGSDLIIKATEEKPLVLTFSRGSEEVTRKLKSNIIINNVPSIIQSGNCYIYAVASLLDEDFLEFRKTSIEPIYSPTEPSNITAGQYWFNTKDYIMYLSDGNKYNEIDELILFIGYIVSENGSILYGNYAINGIYDTGWYNIEYSTTYSKNHNIGSDQVTYNAYVGYNNINYGDFSFALQGSSIIDLHPVGDRVSLITKNTIQTTRYFNIPYSPQAASAVYGPTNQHRVIVKRAW